MTQDNLYEREAAKLDAAADNPDVTLRLRGVRMLGVDYDHDTEGRPIYNAFDALLAGTRLHTWSNSQGETVHYEEDYPGGPVTGRIMPAVDVLTALARSEAEQLREQGAEFGGSDDAA